VVISNKADAYGLVRARNHGIPAEFIDHRSFDDREAYDARLVKVLHAHDVRLVCLAGFMRLLTPVFLSAFPGRILNIHPALLPSFPGMHGHRDALNYGVRFSGCTVHFLDEGIDTGPIVAQAVVPVYEDDSESTLAARILKEEHRIYPMAIRLFLEGKLTISGKKVFTGNAGKTSDSSLRNPDA
jgi:phosphoribosylglycinamide formyltransferase-1